jgi:hypothetical protein
VVITYEVSWAEAFQRCAEIAEEVDGVWCPWNLHGVYGVPRGGCVPAVLVAAHLDLPMVDVPAANILVVDDLVDSGATQARFEGSPFVALYRKSWSPLTDGSILVPGDAWVTFPWEAGEAPAVDAVLRLLQVAHVDTSLAWVQTAAHELVHPLAEAARARLDHPARAV